MFNRNSFIGRLDILGLSTEDKKKFFKLLEKELLNIFAKDYYKNEEELQEDFINFRRSKNYNDLLKIILDTVEEELNIKLTISDLERLNANRFKICSVCNLPFLSFDNFNKMKICYKRDYIKYKMKTKTKKEFFKNTLKVSECFMAYRNLNSSAYYHNKK